MFGVFGLKNDLNKESIIKIENLNLKTTKLKRICRTDGGGDYFGGQRFSSRNSSILLVSVFTSVLYNRKGGWAPGARSFKMSGFLKVGENKETQTKTAKEIES